jgi:hypothetical protein
MHEQFRMIPPHLISPRHILSPRQNVAPIVLNNNIKISFEPATTRIVNKQPPPP